MYFETARLTGRRFLEKDREAAIDILMDPTVRLTYMLPDFADREGADKLFDRLLFLSQAQDHYVIAICLEDRLIGWINDTEQKRSSIELGYVLHPRYHNQGYMTEAVQAAIKDLYARGYSEVIAGAFEGNLASIRVMEKCGMVPLEHTDEITYRGIVHRCVYYGKTLSMC